jgi:type II secretory pathway component HofQ
MPKKTAYSRSGAQRNKARQKSFELVRPGSNEKSALATVESRKKAEVAEAEVEEKQEVEVEEAEEVEAAGSKEEEEAEEKQEPEKKGEKRANAKVIVSETPAATSATPKSAAARLAARRQAAQKAQQRSTTNLILAENYAYVRKDLVFILILAVIMFSAIIALHFIVGG